MRQMLRCRITGILFAMIIGREACVAQGQTPGLGALLDRTGKQVSTLLDQFSSVKCTEHVKQEKFGKDDKVELQQDSTYDYLVILTNSGGELTLDESRLPVKEAKGDKKNRPLLVSNGFATLFLVFHPYYSGSFQFSAQGEEVIAGRALAKIGFQHIRGRHSVAALALRGREYPLELSGTAWIDPQTGSIAKMDASIENTLQDIGLNMLRSRIEYAPAAFKNMKENYWLPSEAVVEVATPRQHWRNTHRFTDYKRFDVSTEEQVASK